MASGQAPAATRQAGTAYFSGTYTHLQALKAKLDPDDWIHLPRTVPLHAV